MQLCSNYFQLKPSKASLNVNVPVIEYCYKDQCGI